MDAGSDWVHAYAHSVLWVIEVLWVAGFLAIFVFYFWIKRRIKKKKAEGASKKQPVE